MKKVFIASAMILAALQSRAQDAPLPDSAIHPALITSSTPVTGDSALVRAAKAAVARRMRETAPVIDTSSMKKTGGHYSQSTSTNTMVPVSSPAVNQVGPGSPPPPAVDRAATEKKIEALKQEERRMHEQDLEPFGGDVEEDLVAKRIDEIPKEVKKLQDSAPPAASQPPPQ
jgi:hypothetical protein